MIARVLEIWVEKETGNFIILRQLVGGIQASWIGDYYYGPIEDPKTFQVVQANFIKRMMLNETDLFSEWNLFQ
jgi:hypothetical protein